MKFISEEARLDILKLAVMICDQNASRVSPIKVTSTDIQIMTNRLVEAFYSLMLDMEDLDEPGHSAMAMKEFFPGALGATSIPGEISAEEESQAKQGCHENESEVRHEKEEE